jgi:putative transposase
MRAWRATTGGKKTVGRKRHLLVDTLGLLWAVLVTPANVTDWHGAEALLRGVRGRLPRLRLIWADNNYQRVAAWAKRCCGWVVEIVKRPVTQRYFAVQPHRWIVERTFAWLVKYRRLARDYEQAPEMSETMIYAAMTHRMLRRLC